MNLPYSFFVVVVFSPNAGDRTERLARAKKAFSLPLGLIPFLHVLESCDSYAEMEFLWAQHVQSMQACSSDQSSGGRTKPCCRAFYVREEEGMRPRHPET